MPVPECHIGASLHHKVKVDRSLLIIPVISFSVGRVITILGHTRERVTFFSAGNWGRA